VARSTFPSQNVQKLTSHAPVQNVARKGPLHGKPRDMKIKKKSKVSFFAKIFGNFGDPQNFLVAATDETWSASKKKKIALTLRLSIADAVVNEVSSTEV